MTSPAASRRRGPLGLKMIARTTRIKGEQTPALFALSRQAFGALR
jgi:hypothetical protein